MELCGVERAEAKRLIAAAGGSVKTAIVMQKLGATRDAGGSEAARMRAA